MLHTHLIENTSNESGHRESLQHSMRYNDTAFLQLHFSITNRQIAIKKLNYRRNLLWQMGIPREGNTNIFLCQVSLKFAINSYKNGESADSSHSK